MFPPSPFVCLWVIESIVPIGSNVLCLIFCILSMIIFCLNISSHPLLIFIKSYFPRLATRLCPHRVRCSWGAVTLAFRSPSTVAGVNCKFLAGTCSQRRDMMCLFCGFLLFLRDMQLPDFASFLSFVTKSCGQPPLPSPPFSGLLPLGEFSFLPSFQTGPSVFNVPGLSPVPSNHASGDFLFPSVTCQCSVDPHFPIHFPHHTCWFCLDLAWVGFKHGRCLSANLHVLTP